MKNDINVQPFTTGIRAIGGTKKQEYIRSAELFQQIYTEQGPYFALMFLADSQYSIKDLAEIASYIELK